MGCKSSRVESRRGEGEAGLEAPCAEDSKRGLVLSAGRCRAVYSSRGGHALMTPRPQPARGASWAAVVFGPM